MIKEIPQDLLDKLKKLQNLEQGAKEVGNLEEAANAADKLHKLLMKHNLDMSTIEGHELQNKIEMLADDMWFEDYYAWKASNWIDDLSRSVARFCLCDAVGGYGKGNRWNKISKVTIVGEKQNVAMAFYFMEQIVSKIKIAFNIAWFRHQGNEDSMRIFRRSFLTGAARAIRTRLMASETEVKTEPGMGLMIISKRKEVEDFSAKLFPNTKSHRSKAGASTSEVGYREGQEAGAGITLNKGLGGVGRKKLGNS